MAGEAGGRGEPRRGRLAPYGLLSPGVLWLVLFFLAPVYILVKTALSSRPSRFANPTFDWAFDNFDTVFTDYGEHIGRSFLFAGTATVLCILIGYPLAYFVAVHGGRWRGLMLGAVIVPFFTSYLIRTLAWQNVLADRAPVVRFLRSLPFTDGDLQLVNTHWAVIGGLTYNFLPFMILPIYVSLEKIDLRLLDASADLYAAPTSAFRRVILPLSLPGVFAGSLLTFIPASGDFVNDELLGNPRQRMIGYVVQNQFFDNTNYEVASALALVLMVIITVLVLLYARLFGTEGLTV